MSAPTAPSPLVNETPQSSPEVSERDDASSASDNDSSDGEPVPALAITRERRGNAGARMARLIEEERVQEAAVAGPEEGDEGYAHIFEEAADDVEFEDAVAEDGDVSMSSSESEDEGQGDEDEGEKELKREATGGKKRKRESLFQKAMRIKKLKHAPILKEKTPDSEATVAPPRPKKKSERVSWLPDAGQVRSSSRKLAVANKQATHQRLKESEKRREKTLAMMQAAEDRKKAKLERMMTQEERLAQAAIIERHNSRSLNRWEESEKRRLDEQRARLEALKNRKLNGPVITYWSGPAVWINGKLKQVGKSPLVEELEAGRDGKSKPSSKIQTEVDETLDQTALNEQAPDSMTGLENPVAPNVTAQETPHIRNSADADENPLETAPRQETSSEQPSFLDGIEYWASNDLTHPPTQSPSLPLLAPKPAVGIASTSDAQGTGVSPPTELANTSTREMSSAITPDLPSPSQHAITLDGPTDQIHDKVLAPDASHPPIRTLALRSLVTLGSFSSLSRHAVRTAQSPPADATSADPPKRNYYRTSDRDSAILLRALFSVPPKSNPPPAPLTRTPFTVLPDTSFTPYDPSVPAAHGPRHSTRYLSKRATHCPITGAVARYRDPVTGLPYASSNAFKMLRGVSSGGSGVWSGLLGAWIGEERAARGVPKEVWEGTVERKEGENGVVAT